MGNHLGKAAINIRPPDSVAFTVHKGMELGALLNGKFHKEQVVKRITAKYVDRSRELRLRFFGEINAFIENKCIWYLLNRTMSTNTKRQKEKLGEMFLFTKATLNLGQSYFGEGQKYCALDSSTFLKET